MAVTLRSSQDDDLAQITAIYAQHVLTGLASFEEQPPELTEMAARRAAVLARGLPYLVAVEDERVLGYAYAGPYRTRPAYRFTLEDSIYMDPGAGRRGVGTQLLSALIDDCARQGYRQMVAVIGDSDNQASIALHRKLGFQMTGVLRAVGFKFGRWVDSVLMQRALGPGHNTLPEAPAALRT